MVAVTVAVINHFEIADITVLFHVCACVVTGGGDTMAVKKFVFGPKKRKLYRPKISCCLQHGTTCSNFLYLI